METALPTAATTSFAAVLDDATARLAAAGIDSARLDAELLLAAAAGLDRSALHVRLRSLADAPILRRFRTNLERRLRREPIQYIRGRQELWALDFEVSPDVLIPRPETELLIENALRLAGHGAVCDVGTGSGCIAITLAHSLRQLAITAIDISPHALAVAQRNAVHHGCAERLRFIESDLFEAVPGEYFGLIVSNPPYVESPAIDHGQRELAFEPRLALDGGTDGLDVIRRLIPAAAQRLTPGGWLLVEIGSGQAAAVIDLAIQSGAGQADVLPDLAGLPRLLRARW